jgi:putative ABC transport system ATP-binding protein
MANMILMEGITKTYHLGELDVPVLKEIDLSIEDGEYVAIMGASGSGKSTLMNIIGCLDRPTSGQYILDGRDLTTLDDDELADK